MEIKNPTLFYVNIFSLYNNASPATDNILIHNTFRNLVISLLGRAGAHMHCKEFLEAKWSCGSTWCNCPTSLTYIMTVTNTPSTMQTTAPRKVE
jgi:hypothetical protein